MSREIEELQPGWDVRLFTTDRVLPTEGFRSPKVEGRYVGRYLSPSRGECLELVDAVGHYRRWVPVAEVTGAERVLGRLYDRQRAKAKGKGR